MNYLHIKKISCIFLFIISITCKINAQDVRIEAELDTNQIFIGEQILLKLQVVHKGSAKTTFPILTDTITKNIEIIEQYPSDTVSNNGETIISKFFKITSFEPGQEMIPPIPFLFSHNGQTDTLTSNALLLTVNTLPVDTTNAIFDIYAPIDTPLTFEEFWNRFSMYIILVVLFIAAIIAFVYYRKKKKQNLPVFKPAKPRIPPHITAFDALDQLKEDKLWQQGKEKLFHSRLTEIIRIYIEERFEIPAMEKTSDEILEQFVKTKLLEKKPFEDLKEILLLADLVKFAKFTPLPDDNDASIRRAYEFVKTTLQSFSTTNESQTTEKQ